MLKSDLVKAALMVYERLQDIFFYAVSDGPGIILENNDVQAFGFIEILIFENKNKKSKVITEE